MGSVGRVVVVTGDAARKATRSAGPRKAVIDLSKNAVERLKYLQQRSGTDSNTFRLGVKEASGCVGAAYSLQFDDKSKSKPALDETVFDEESGIKVVVDPAALMYVIGTTMDYVEGDAESQFIFYNPNATAVCGCGQSFSIDPKHKE